MADETFPAEDGEGAPDAQVINTGKLTLEDAADLALQSIEDEEARAKFIRGQKSGAWGLVLDLVGVLGFDLLNGLLQKSGIKKPKDEKKDEEPQ